MFNTLSMRAISIFAILIIASLLISRSWGVDELKARADLLNSQGQKVGIATFEEDSRGVKVSVQLRRMPRGTHGLHIHDHGTCEPPKFESAGSHFNPGHREHGFLNPKGPHAGDLPNITVGSLGTGRLVVHSKLITLKKGAPNSLFKQGGTSLIVHAAPDDYVSDPAGGGGDRIACGVILPVEESGIGR